MTETQHIPKNQVVLSLCPPLVHSAEIRHLKGSGPTRQCWGFSKVLFYGIIRRSSIIKSKIFSRRPIVKQVPLAKAEKVRKSSPGGIVTASLRCYASSPSNRTDLRITFRAHLSRTSPRVRLDASREVWKISEKFYLTTHMSPRSGECSYPLYWPTN